MVIVARADAEFQHALVSSTDAGYPVGEGRGDEKEGNVGHLSCVFLIRGI